MDWKNYAHDFEGLAEYLARIGRKKAELDALGPLPVAAVANIRSSFTLEWTYNSNSIEGNTLPCKKPR